MAKSFEEQVAERVKEEVMKEVDAKIDALTKGVIEAMESLDKTTSKLAESLGANQTNMEVVKLVLESKGLITREQFAKARKDFEAEFQKQVQAKIDRIIKEAEEKKE